MNEERNPGTAALTVGLCFLGALCEGFDVQAAGVAAGGLSRQLHPTPINLSAFFAASGAGLLLGAIVRSDAQSDCAGGGFKQRATA